MFARYLVDRGHHVRVYAFQGDDLPGVELILLDKPRGVPRFAHDWETARRIAKRLETDDADVRMGGQKFWGCEVLHPVGGVEGVFWQAHVRHRLAKPLPAFTRHFHLKRYFDLAGEARGYHDPRLRCVVAEADLVRRQLLQFYPELNGKIRVVFQGTGLSTDLAAQRETHRRTLLPSFGMAPDRPIALFMGHDFFRKGLRHAIEAVAAANRKDPLHAWQLLVAGRDETRPFRRLVQDLGIADDVKFVGSVPDPSACYAAADVLLFPTTFDSFAIVTVEAMSAGTPVITTVQNGGSEIIEEGRNGWVLPDPAMTERMADHLLELRDPEKRRAMKDASIATAKQHTAESKFKEIESILVSAAR